SSDLDTRSGLFWRAHATGWIESERIVEQCGIVSLDPWPHSALMIGVAGGNGVDPHPAVCRLQCKSRHVADDRRLHRSVRSGSEVGFPAGDTRDGDQRRHIALLQMRD